MTLLTAYALSRIAVGGAVLLAPTTASRPWLGPVSGDHDARAALRMFGVRDALLGVAVLAVRRQPEALPVALGLCIAADAADAVVCLAQGARTRRPGALLASAAAVTGAVTGALALRRTRAG